MKHQGVPRRARRLLQSAASAALMVLLLRWACRDVDLLVVAERLSSLSAPWLALLVLLNLAALGVRGWRWMLLVRPFAPEVTCLDTSLALGICYAANVPVPRSGEFVRAVSLRWSRGAGITATLATVVVERVLDLAWLVVFLGLSLAVLRGRLELLFPGVSLLCAGVLAACFVVLVLLAIAAVHQQRVLLVATRFIRRLPGSLAQRVAGLLDSFLGGLQALRSPSAYAEILASSIVLELTYTSIIWSAFHGLGLAQRYGVGFGAATVTMALSSAGVMVPTPGAVGSYHAFFARPLAHLYAVDPADALACATAVHAVATLTYVAVGLPAFVLQRRAARRRAAAARACE